MSFPEFDASDELFVFAKQVDEFVKDDSTMFMILVSMKAKNIVAIGELPMASDFPKVVPDNICDCHQSMRLSFP